MIRVYNRILVTERPNVGAVTSQQEQIITLGRRRKRVEIATTISSLAIPAVALYPAVTHPENFFAIYGSSLLAFLGVYLAGYRKANRIDRRIENIRNQVA